MNQRKQYPPQRFCWFDMDWHSYARSKLQSIDERIGIMSDDELLRPNRDEMVQYLVELYKLNPIELNDQYEQIPKDVKVRKTGLQYFESEVLLDGLQITRCVPFSGDVELLEVQPTHFLMASFEFLVERNRLVFTASDDFVTLEKNNTIERKLDDQVACLREELEYLKNDVNRFNNALVSHIRGLLDKREKQSRIKQTVCERMNIPLKRNNLAPEIIPVKRTLIRPVIPAAVREKNHTIEDSEYQHILNVIRHSGSTFERTRKTFAVHTEEELRDIILADLNGHYEGLANGETFRQKGKTDICIEFENRAAFVGECKIWKGTRMLVDTVAQLLSYTTWRDSKTAIIFFNKNNKSVQEIVEKIDNTIPTIQGYQNKNESKTGEWKFSIRDKSGDGDLKTIHIFLFDLYVDK